MKKQDYYALIISFLFLSYTHIPLFATDGLSFKDARSTALGGSSAALISFQNNASLCFKESHGAELSYENRYGVKELSSYSAAVHYSFPYMVVSGMFNRFGYEKYNRTMVGLGVSKQLTATAALGLYVHYADLYQSTEDGSERAITSDLSISFKFPNQIMMGIVANNFLSAFLSGNRTQLTLPLRIRGGISYQPTDQFLVTTEVEYLNSVGKHLIGRVGFEYIVFDVLALRMGFLTTPLQPTFGIGYSHASSFGIALSSSYHTTLGFSPTISAQFNF